MTNPYRVLCAELLAAIQLYTKLNPAASDMSASELTEKLMDAMAATAAALAEPVAVSERWPNFSDCDPQERVWAWNPVLDHWKLSRINRSVHTHWLPAHALPTPEATND